MAYSNRLDLPQPESPTKTKLILGRPKELEGVVGVTAVTAVVGVVGVVGIENRLVREADRSEACDDDTTRW